MSVASELFNSIQDVLEPLQNPTEAAEMAAYMRNQFVFLGIKKDVRNAATKKIIHKKNITLPADALQELVLRLWAAKPREYQYVALDLLRIHEKQLTPADLVWIQNLVKQKPWWDTVDVLAANTLGKLVLHYPERDTYRMAWLHDSNIWLNRTAIIHQLRYKDKTDVRFLELSIRTHGTQREFFIAKAIGWALREYAKTNPNWVDTFVKSNKTLLRPLSVREALRHKRVKR